MKQLLLLGILLLLLPLGVRAGDPDGQTGIEIRSVQAGFRQEKHLPILARPLVSEGIFLFEAPGSLRWEYLVPLHTVLLMHGGVVKKFVEREGELAEERGMGLDAMQVVLSEIGGWLDGRFAGNAMFAVSFADERTVLLTPKEKGLAALITSIELELAEQKGLLDRVTINEGPDSFTRLTFENRILNEEIPPSRFTIP